MKRKSQLSIIIISYNTKTLLKRCIDSLYRFNKDITFELIIVDNNSTDGSVKYLKHLISKQNIHAIFNTENLGFSKANNVGVAKATSKYVLLLNSDTEFHSSILKDMLDWMEQNKKVGIATCALKNKNGTIQGTGGYFPNLLRVFSWMIIQDLPFIDKLIKPFHPMKEKSFIKGDSFYKDKKEVDWVTGAFLLARKIVFEQAGDFDEDYFMYTEETDLCYRVKMLGWQVWYLPKWSIVHLGGASGTKENAVLNEIKGVKLFYKKHYPPWQYPVLRLILKIGFLGRSAIFGILEGRDSAKTYAKAFYAA
jgi:hypothetical protein